MLKNIRCYSMAEKSSNLEEVVAAFHAPIRFAAAYGSGAFPQNGYNDKVAGKDTMVDFIFGVTHPVHWHSLNMRQNPTHYSYLKHFGATAVSRVQDKYGGKIYYNTNVVVSGNRIKYGVISIDSLLKDLTDWETFYVAGRMQKPVRILREDARVRLASSVNLMNALRVSLLMLPESFSEEELFLRIAGLSYKGSNYLIKVILE